MVAARALDSKKESQGLHVLAMDDELSDLRHLCQLLWGSSQVANVVGARDANDVSRLIRREHFDAVFLDISVPGMNGLDLADRLTALADPPIIVFVTGFKEHAVRAFEIYAADYLVKPVDQERLSTALSRVIQRLDLVMT
jgi:DNA-binding LytR/AlgR family response regulator